MATMREVEKMIQAIRECDNMIRYISEYPHASTMMEFLRGTSPGVRDAMVGGLIERRNNFVEALERLGIVDEYV